MERREFLKRITGGIGAGLFGTAATAAEDRKAKESETGIIMTVEGPIQPGALGPTLPHEHVMVDFIGADRVSSDRYDPEAVFQVALPYLERVREKGCQSLVECTPAYLGRDPLLLRRLAKASGLNLLTNTGYYGAAKRKFLPDHAYSEAAEQLAGRWINEWRHGIENSGIRPGFIKTGVDAGPLNAVYQKLLRAAARCHLQTGLTIAAHTGNGTAALEELALLKEEGVSGRAFIWVHAQNEKDREKYREAAEQGAWIELDGLRPTNVGRYTDDVLWFKKEGLLSQLLLSHDAGWYHVGETGGGPFRSYDTLFEELLPVLAQAGLDEREVKQIIEINPREAFTVRVRKA